jgi:predicted kinase
MAKLTIIRGLPGSGKSTLAKKLVYTSPGSVHLEADMYFIDRGGVYKYDPAKIKDAHNWCFQSAEIFLRNGTDVVVSNTFTQIWEFQKYIDVAKEIGCNWGVLAANGNFPNIHNVPPEVIIKMANRWEDF